MTAEETVAWLAGFISARNRKDLNPRPNQDQWDHIVGMLAECRPSESDKRQYSVGIMPLANCS